MIIDSFEHDESRMLMVEEKVLWLKHFKLKIFLVAIITVLFIEMTDMLNGKFDFSFGLLIALVVSLLIIPFILVDRTEKIINVHYDSDEKNITNKGFTYFFVNSAIGLTVIILLTFLSRWFPLVEFFELSSDTAKSLGIIVFIFLVIITIVLKFWPLTILITIIGGQHLIFLFGDGSTQISYTMIVMGTLLVLFIVGVIIMSILIHRDRDELD